MVVFFDSVRSIEDWGLDSIFRQVRPSREWTRLVLRVTVVFHSDRRVRSLVG